MFELLRRGRPGGHVAEECQLEVEHLERRGYIYIYIYIYITCVYIHI